MAKEAGVVKSLTGKAVAVDQNGNERELKVGDIVYMGESVKTSDAADKVTIVANNGKELTVLGSDTLSLNPNTIGAEGLADISALQNAILNGGDLTKLEETAAGGNAAAGGGDGVSLGEARFAEGGHYSNINETYRNLTDTNRAFASYDSPIGGYSDGNSNGGDLIPLKPSVSVKFTEDKNDDGFLTYTENFDNNASSHDLNTSPVKITVANVIPGDILHVTLTKPDGTTEDKVVTIDQNIINNGYEIPNMPVAEGKISKVDAYVTDSADPNTIKSNEASDSVEPDVRPTLTFTEDIGIGANIDTNNPGKNDGGIDDFENSQDGNFRSTTVEVTLPKDVVAGDKIVITYTDPLTKQDTTKIVPLTQADVDNHKVNTSLPVFPDVTNNASVHVETHDGIQKSAESDKDSVMPIGRNMEIQFIEQVTLHEISRQESMNEHEVNETTALIRLPNKIDNGDIVTLTINEPTNGVYTRNFTIHMDDKGVITGITEIGNGEQNFPLTKESFNQYSFKVPGFDLRHGQDTTIKASITNMTPGRHTDINEPEVSASLEHVKAPVVEFDKKVINRESLTSDAEGILRTTATIKIPKNAVDGDRIEVKITEPQLDGATKDRTIKFNVHKDALGVKITDEHGNDVAVSDNGFKISNVGTLTGAETKISATIIDKDGIQSATGTNSVSVTELDDSGIFFVEDADANTSITREESMKDHYLHKKKGDLHETDDYLHKTDLEVKVPNNVITGDKMILEVKADGNTTLQKEFTITRNGNSITLTHGTNTITADSDNKITVSGIVIGEGKNTEAKATFTDAKNHAKTIVTNHATLEKLHDDMTVIFKEDKDFNGILNRDEASSDGVLDKTTATIKLPSNVVDGDVLKITTSIENGAETHKPYTIHKDAQGKITIDGLTVVGNTVEYTVPLEEDKTSKISATVSDATGVDKVKAGSDITLDADGNGNGTKFYVLIDEDKDRNGKLSRDEANSDGSVKETSATVSLPSGDLHADDTFTVKVNGVPTTYKVTSKVGDVLKIEDKDGNVHLEDGNLLKIDGIAVSVKDPAKVEVELPNIAPKSAEAILEPINNKELSVIFNEDNANRNNELSRDEAISDNNLKITTVSVKVPYNVVTGDKVIVDITDPNTGVKTPRTFEITKKDGVITAKEPGHKPQDITKTNTIEVDSVPMKPGEKTKVDATITTQDGQTASGSAEAKLEQLSSKGLSVSIAADANDNGIITRDESGSNKSKVNVSLPGNIIAGDSIKVEITNPGDTTPKIKGFKVLSKDALGNIKLQDQDDHINSSFILENGKPLVLDAAVAVGIDTVAKVTLTDAFGNSVSTAKIDQNGKEINVKAHAEIDVARGIQFTEDTSRDGALQDYENSNDQDTTPIKVYLNEDARVGDTVEIKYTDPDNHTQVKTQTHTLSGEDITNGAFEQVLDINPISKYDLKVDATYKTHDGLETKLPAETLSILPKAVTAEYNEHTTMKGGDNNSDTLIVDGHGQTIDFSKVTDLDAKVESFENIQLQGNTEIKFDAKAIFDITDSLNTILKIKGDATNKVDIKGKWELEKDPSIHADAGFKGYSSVDQVSGHTIHIQIDDKVQTDL